MTVGNIQLEHASLWIQIWGDYSIWFPLKLQEKLVIELVELKKLKDSDGKMS